VSEDPETARQIAELSLDSRPLLVLDVDEVLIEFVRPFVRFLDCRGVELRLETFRLYGNAVHRATGKLLEDEEVAGLLEAFFEVQADWQTAAEGAAEAVAALADRAEVVMLTAMPHRHRAIRRAHLDRLGFRYPLLTTETPKGPAIRRLRGAAGRPVAFVDDIPGNLSSVRASVSDAHLFHLMATPSLRRLLPPLDEGILAIDDWRLARPEISRALGIQGSRG
jgi:hypothetical protein